MVMKINLSTIENIEDMRSVPPGDYRCKVAEVRESQSPAGHTRWGIRWEVIKGEFQGRTACWDSLHWSERGLPRVKFVLQALGVAADGELQISPDELTDVEVIVEVRPEEREDPITGVRRLQNRVPFTGYAAVSV
jgi:hypothetical protein|tara:strand:+ start:59 stop:463 length:405 start_codon:yes stop_codon:yes gene_type:complete